MKKMLKNRVFRNAGKFDSISPNPISMGIINMNRKFSIVMMTSHASRNLLVGWKFEEQIFFNLHTKEINVFSILDTWKIKTALCMILLLIWAKKKVVLRFFLPSGKKTWSFSIFRWNLFSHWGFRWKVFSRSFRTNFFTIQYVTKNRKNLLLIFLRTSSDRYSSDFLSSFM